MTKTKDVRVLYTLPSQCGTVKLIFAQDGIALDYYILTLKKNKYFNPKQEIDDHNREWITDHGSIIQIPWKDGVTLFKNLAEEGEHAIN